MRRSATEHADLSELLRQCLAGLTQPLPALHAWINRIEARP
jgi:hypothetical protein